MPRLFKTAAQIGLLLNTQLFVFCLFCNIVGGQVKLFPCEISLCICNCLQFEENPFAYNHLLIKLEGLDDGVLDHYCQFVTSASKMMKLEVKKK